MVSKWFAALLTLFFSMQVMALAVVLHNDHATSQLAVTGYGDLASGKKHLFPLTTNAVEASFSDHVGVHRLSISSTHLTCCQYLGFLSVGDFQKIVYDGTPYYFCYIPPSALIPLSMPRFYVHVRPLTQSPRIIVSGKGNTCGHSSSRMPLNVDGQLSWDKELWIG